MSVSSLEQISVQPVHTDEELRLAIDLMAKEHGRNFHTSIDWLNTHSKTYPGFQREHTRIAYIDDEIAGALRLTTDTVRIGEARLKMGGLGWVTTVPRHRKKGVCTALMNDTLDYMARHQYHVSMLFGIPNFYHRFGYTTTLADYRIKVESLDTADEGAPVMRFREAKPGDIQAIQKIHHLNDGEVSCSLIRSEAHITNKWDPFKSAKVLINDEGKVEGYVWPQVDDDHLMIHEAGAAHEEAFHEVMAYCNQVARDSFKPSIHFSLPPEHPFAHYLTRYASIHERKLQREEGGMMRFIDVPEALESMLPEWESRLQNSLLREFRCEITLMTDDRSFCVHANRGAIDVLPGMGKNKFSVTDTELIQLVTGYVHLDGVYRKQARLVNSHGKALLNILFPKRNPYVYTFDRF